LRPSFTLIELIIVIIIIGILAFAINFSFSNNNLQIAADKLVRDLRYTHSLALKNDKYYPIPESNTTIDENKSKYWFKQWWQLRIGRKTNGDYFYEIFSDSATSSKTTNFNKIGGPVSEYALNPLNTKYMSGNYNSNTSYNYELNLSKYNIKLIQLNCVDFTSSRKSIRFLFDNFGHVFLDEGKSGDKGDINPLDSSNRPMLTKNENLKLCLDNPCKYTKDRCVQINITPTGFVYLSKCLPCK
jgi:prepilin-type N-terminal cleavage/methylation domain-containing protein